MLMMAQKLSGNGIADSVNVVAMVVAAVEVGVMLLMGMSRHLLIVFKDSLCVQRNTEGVNKEHRIVLLRIESHLLG